MPVDISFNAGITRASLVFRHPTGNILTLDLMRQIRAALEDLLDSKHLRLLTIEGYARIDMRLTADNKLYFIEANPNPILADDEDFALAAGKSGLAYPQLIERIVRQGMNTVRD